MLIPVRDLSQYWFIEAPPRVLHVGGHEAEELHDYTSNGWGWQETVWVEAIPEKAQIIREKTSSFLGHSVIETVAWDQTGLPVTFKVTNNGQSSSALELEEHLEVYPEIVVSREIQCRSTALQDLDIWNGHGDVFLNLDIQGAELRALLGLGEKIDQCVAIYTELNTRRLYKDCALFNEVDSFLRARGFRLADKVLSKRLGWGDGLYLREGSRPLDLAPLNRMRRRFGRVSKLIREVSERVRARWVA